jgi:rubrerythrin
VLIEDDPDAVEATLKFLYGVLEHDPGDATGTSENLNYWVDLHTVADKYDVPELRDYVTEQVGDAVRDYAIDRMPKDSGDAAFVELVCRVYDLESHASKENRLLCKEIVTWLSYEKELSEEVGLRLGPVFRDCVAAKAEFAQDMILLATKETSAGKHFLQGQFRCDICEYDWEVVIGDPQSQSCPFCLQTPQQLRTFRLSWS